MSRGQGVLQNIAFKYLTVYFSDSLTCIVEGSTADSLPRIVAGPTKDCLSIRIENGNLSDHKHYPTLGLDEGVRMLHCNGIYLGRGDWTAVLSHVQLPAVDDIRYLLGAKASAPLCKNIQYGFLYLHFQSLDEMVTNSTFPSI